MRSPAHRPLATRDATGRRARPGTSGLIAFLVLLLTAGPALLAPAAGAAPGDPTSPSTSATPAPLAAATPIQVDLVAISPATPNAASLEQPVAVTAILTNVSSTAYSSVRVLLERGAPIVQRVLLHEALAVPPRTDQWSTEPPLVLPEPLAPGASVTVVYPTTSQAMGLFLNGVYPYALVAEGRTATGGPYREAGRAAAVVPSFVEAPVAPLAVSWLWPLIDVPHVSAADALLDAGAVFDDDDLATSVRSGGRLDRALRVVEAVTPAVRMTLVLDPQLINELLTMGEGYTVRIGSAPPVPGTGADAARAWLARLKAVAGQHDLVLTGLADPDLNAIAAGGLPATAPLSAALAQRVSAALGAPYRTNLVWPAGESLSQMAADAALSASVGSVVLRDTALTGGTHPDTSTSAGGMIGEVRGLSDTALTPLVISGSSTSAGAGIVLDSSLRQRVIDATDAIQVRAAGDRSATTEADNAATSGTRIQALVSELAMWPLAGAAGGGYVALAPDRAVDPDATAAASAILATAATGWTTIVPTREAVLSAARIDRGGLAASGAGLDPSIVSAVRAADGRLGAADELLGTAGAALLAPARAALVLATSSGWRGDAASGLAYAQAADATAQAIVAGVSVVTPDNASYSLSSENSPLIITVRNDLEVAVSVKLMVEPASASVSGFRADDIGVQVVEPNTARTLQIPAHFERSGRFEVVAQLATESGAPLGEPVRLSVLCTAYGTVALTITIAAFALLLLLLVFRAVRGLRRAHRARSLAATRPPVEPRLPTSGSRA